jgi:adenosine deaminase
MIELHCHLDGTIGAALVENLRSRGVDLGVEPASLRPSAPITTWEEWKAAAEPLLPVLQNDRWLVPTLQCHIESLARQGVTYAELMIGLLDPTLDCGSLVDRVRGYRHAADEAACGAVEVAFLVAMHRRRDPVWTGLLGDQLQALARAGLVAGIAICGRESAGPIRDPDWAQLLFRVREAGLGVEIHAGEFGGPESVRDALDHGSPDRIGHALRAFEDERLIAELRERDIHIEFCPTSNLRLGAVSSLDRHPIIRAMELGMNFSFNTDDPGPFECTMASERDLLVRFCGFTEADFGRIRRNAWRSRFGINRDSHQFPAGF